MASAFASREKAPQSKEQKKVSSLAKRDSNAARDRQKSGPCVIVYQNPDLIKPEVPASE